MRYLIVTAALVLFGSSAHAGWFGPSTVQECHQQYAVPAKTRRAALLAANSCRTLFAAGVDPIDAAEAQCVLDRVDSVETDQGAGILASSCGSSHPYPVCPEHKAYSTTCHACVWTCPAGYRYEATTHTCRGHIVDPFAQPDATLPLGFTLDSPSTMPILSTDCPR